MNRTEAYKSLESKVSWRIVKVVFWVTALGLALIQAKVAGQRYCLEDAGCSLDSNYFFLAFLPFFVILYFLLYRLLKRLFIYILFGKTQRQATKLTVTGAIITSVLTLLFLFGLALLAGRLLTS